MNELEEREALESALEEEMEAESGIEDMEAQEEEDEVSLDSDEELQEAFAAGLIKPGLNTVYSKARKEKKEQVNDQIGLRQKLQEFRPSKSKWLDRLDLTNAPAPIAPELAYKEDLQKVKYYKISTQWPKLL